MTHLVRDLVARFGRSPLAELALAPDSDEDVDRWFVAAWLQSARASEEVIAATWTRLRDGGLSTPDAIEAAGAEALAKALESGGYPQPELAAVRLARACAALCRDWSGSAAGLVDGSDDLEDAGRRLVALAPGLGPGTALRFLRPLRDRFAAAREVPLDENARAAALHLGLIGEGDDLDGEPGALRAALAADASGDPPALADLEAALARLGRSACRRGRVDRCPLGDGCPRRGEAAQQS